VQKFVEEEKPPPK